DCGRADAGRPAIGWPVRAAASAAAASSMWCGVIRSSCCGLLLLGRIKRAEEFERRGDPAAAMRDAGAVQAHLNPAQRAAQHQIVEMAEMTDAEDLALQFAKPETER